MKIGKQVDVHSAILKSRHFEMLFRSNKVNDTYTQHV